MAERADGSAEPRAEDGDDLARPGAQDGDDLARPGAQDDNDLARPGAQDDNDLARPGAQDGDDLALEALWKRVLVAWDDEKSHGALLEFALRTHALAAVAARYRTLVDHPEKGARVRHKLEGVATAATNLLFSTRTPRARRRVPLSITLSAFGTCALLLVWLAWALWGAR